MCEGSSQRVRERERREIREERREKREEREREERRERREKRETNLRRPHTSSLHMHISLAAIPSNKFCRFLGDFDRYQSYQTQDFSLKSWQSRSLCVL